jgi:uncharacterized hydrophobic protein (TIGR00271 family)
VLQLRAYGPLRTLTEVGRILADTGRASRLTLTPGVHPDHGQLSGDVRRDDADGVLEFLTGQGVAPGDISVVALDDFGPGRPARGTTTLIWADMLGQARSNARPVARYLAFMVIAGVIAGYGVITVNETLIVGAMAVSPDTLPVTAACVGLVDRRWRLVGRALVTLAVGLASTGLAALLITRSVSLLGLLPNGFAIGTSDLSGLVSVGTGTVGVALAAGVAAMLALETRASAAVGVAISVTTIPAAAYLGVAGAAGAMDKVWGALAVLGVNVAMLLVGGTATLAVQRLLRPRGRFPDAPVGGTPRDTAAGGEAES